MFKKEKDFSEKEDKKSKEKGGKSSISFEFDKKKIIILVIVCLLILGCFYGFKFYKSYTEKKEKEAKAALVDDGTPAILKNAIDYKGHWSEVYMTEIVKRGILKETSMNTLSPDGKTIRAQYMVALYTLDNGRTPTDTSNIVYFEDVLDNFFYTDAINWGSSNKFINGVSATKFVPNYQLTKEQAVTILFNYYKARYKDNNDYTRVELPYSDANKVSAYAEKAMKWAYINNLFVYNKEDMINPNEDFTRGEVAALLFCYIYDIDENEAYNPNEVFQQYLEELAEQKKLEEEERKKEAEQAKKLEELEENSGENEGNIDIVDDKVNGLIEEDMENNQTKPEDKEE